MKKIINFGTIAVAIAMVLALLVCAVAENMRCSASEIETTTEAHTEAHTEEVTEEATEAQTEIQTEAATEGSTEVPTEAEAVEIVEETAEDPTEVPTEEATEPTAEVYAETVKAECPTEEPYIGYNPDWDTGVGAYNPYMYCRITPVSNHKIGIAYIADGWYMCDSLGHCWAFDNPEYLSGYVGIVYDICGTDDITDDVLVLILADTPIIIEEIMEGDYA